MWISMSPTLQWNRERFTEWVLSNEILTVSGEPKYKLSSGRQSHIYVGWKRIMTDVFLVQELVDWIVAYLRHLSMVKDFRPDTIIGVSEGCSILGALVQVQWSPSSGHFAPGTHAISMLRGVPKDHGAEKDRRFVGIPKGRTLVLEDVVTTGESTGRFINELLKEGVDVAGVVTLTYRGCLGDEGISSAASRISEITGKNFVISDMSDLQELLRLNHKMRPFPKEFARAIYEEFPRFELEPLSIRR